jgi:hypothetical protein
MLRLLSLLAIAVSLSACAVLDYADSLRDEPAPPQAEASQPASATP